MQQDGHLPVCFGKNGKTKNGVDYYAFMQSPVWRQLAHEARKRANFTCQRCGARSESGSSGVILTVHHLTYARFGGQELAGDLEVLCQPCHDAEHQITWRPASRGEKNGGAWSKKVRKAQRFEERRAKREREREAHEERVRKFWR